MRERHIAIIACSAIAMVLAEGRGVTLLLHKVGSLRDFTEVLWFYEGFVGIE
ncbi:hypothetical protein [Psychrobacter pygoscelis]|uniref:hypothetical protein n=1 Tax=Psychrobacter pygoscelis TaxID=2488563 RepID=UPI0013F40EDD|nr:hypothetical protein [Psychrobacter pygoscelis]